MLTRSSACAVQLRHLERAGLPAEAVYHPHHTLDGYTLGYSLQVIDFPGVNPEAEALFEKLAPELPYLTEHFRPHSELHEQSGCETGLDLILDGPACQREEG